MKVDSISLEDEKLIVVFEHDIHKFGAVVEFNILGDGVFDSITDYIEHSGNVVASVNFKLNVKYRGGIFRWKHTTRCYKLVADSSDNTMKIYIDGLLTSSYDCEWVMSPC